MDSRQDVLFLGGFPFAEQKSYLNLPIPGLSAKNGRLFWSRAGVVLFVYVMFLAFAMTCFFHVTLRSVRPPFGFQSLLHTVANRVANAEPWVQALQIPLPKGEHGAHLLAPLVGVVGQALHIMPCKFQNRVGR